MRGLLAWMCDLFFTEDVRRLEKCIDRERTRHSKPIEIPTVLLRALLVAEDHRFLCHSGFDIIALLRAIRNYTLSKKVGGGSTIEQQYVRTLLQAYQPTIRRKIREISLASWLSGQLPKRSIAERYLEVAYFGARMNGIKQAADRLGLELSELSDRDAALLIAALKYPFPSRLSSSRLRKLYARQRYIQQRMLKVTIKGFDQ